MLQADEIINGLSALAQEHRLAIFRLLVQKGSQGMAAGEIASSLDLPPSSLSFHLSHLSRAQLIQCERQSRQLIYRADYAQMNLLIAYLMENCCLGDNGRENQPKTIDDM